MANLNLNPVVQIKVIFTNARVGLQEMKSKCPDKLIMGHLNINSIRNKFDALSVIVRNNVDILMISETKQFLFHGFIAPYRLDRNSKGGGFCRILGRV